MKNMSARPQSMTDVAAYRDVELALRPRIMQRYLTAHKTANTADPCAKAACHILDAKYEPGKRCSILYQLGEQMMIGEMVWNGEARQPADLVAPSAASVAGTRRGWARGTLDAGAPRARASLGACGTADSTPLLPNMQVYPYERDPGLPALTTVQDEKRMTQILNGALPQCVEGEQRVVRCRVTLLRYRLGKRCTLRYDLRLRDAKEGRTTKRTVYGKLYHSTAKAQAVYGEMQRLSAEEALRGSSMVLAAAVAYIPELPMVLQAPVDGCAPLDLLLQPSPNPTAAEPALAADGIRRAAAALAALHQSTTTTERIRAVDAELGRLQQRSARIMDVDATKGKELYELAKALPTWLAQVSEWGAEIGLVHGDCKPSQFFLMREPASRSGDGRGQAALLDFDHCGMADPAADVGNFLATLRQMGVKQILKQGGSPQGAAVVEAQRQTLAILEEAFLDKYLVAAQGASDFAKRATWYQAVALLRKALRSFARSTRSPLPSLLVQEAWRCLDELDVD